MRSTPVNGERPYAKQNFPKIFITKKIRTQRLNYDRPFLAVIFLSIMIFYTYVQKISCLSRFRIRIGILFGPVDLDAEKELIILMTSSGVVGAKSKEL